MLSFITISQNSEKVALLQDNLDLIFGRSLPWELLVADGNEDDIFTGFNRMASIANGDFLVFTHDDVQFLGTRSVFDAPINLMKKPLTGLVGAAGTRLMPKEGCWWKSFHLDCRGAVYHPSNEQPFGMHLNGWPHMAAQFGRVAVVDGVLLMCSRVTFEKLTGFDHQSFSGFHFYDMDLSVRAHLLGLSNYVAPIPLLHKSHGVTNDEWETNRLIFIEKHRKILPIKV